MLAIDGGRDQKYCTQEVKPEVKPRWLTEEAEKRHPQKNFETGYPGIQLLN
jgi:hypothetical protein